MKKTGNRKETVRIGRIGSPVGIRGEVRVNLYAHDSDNLKEGKVLLFDVPGGATKDAAGFETEEGRALLRSWGVDDKYAGVGNCILGYPDCPHPEAKPRKENYVVRV